ncbi:MAG: GGDEF domain-containing protein [Pseudomonadota bacterium]
MSQPDQQDEIRALEAEIARLQDELKARESEIATLKTMVDQDMFLPLLNRRAFEREFTRAWSAAKRYEFPVSLIYLDLNNMKQINDEFGHDAGDKALRSVAKVLRENCRQSDLTGRLGGDEFGVVMVQADAAAARRKAAELAQLVAKTEIKSQARKICLSVSYGVAGGAGNGPVSAIIRTADRRMYEMKQSGGRVSPETP